MRKRRDEAANPGLHTARERARRISDRDAYNAKAQARRALRPGHAYELNRRWVEAHPEQYRRTNTENTRRWRAEHPDERGEYDRRRRETKAHLPDWER